MGRGRHHDHALSGEWADYRDCHVKPDLVLVSLARTMPTDRILTCRCGMTLVGRGRSSD